MLRIGCLHREFEKKSEPAGDDGSDPGGESDSLETFRDRLRDRCAHDRRCHGADRSDRIKSQAEHAVALAGEAGLLIEASFLAEELRADGVTWVGSEHFVEYSELDQRYGKTTIPPAFGLFPELRSLPSVNLRDEPDLPSIRKVIEFVPATPLEYLCRWICCNELFADAVRLVSVIRWPNGEVSFGITQPQYHGEPAELRDIEKHFTSNGWERLNDPSGHTVFYNFAFDVIAIDIERRNCYLRGNDLLPFDVILRQPDDGLAEFLGIR